MNMQQDFDGRTPAADWVPAVDIAERPDSFVLRADLPGVAPEDIEITLNEQVLTLAGSRGPSTLQNAARPHRSERTSGRFLRRFTLPASIDGDAIEARSAHGTLEITVPKLPEIQPRRIAVDAA